MAFNVAEIGGSRHDDPSVTLVSSAPFRVVAAVRVYRLLCQNSINKIIRNGGPVHSMRAKGFYG
jgi:hypothetical protein